MLHGRGGEQPAYYGVDKDHNEATVYPTDILSHPEDPYSYSTLWYVARPWGPPCPFSDWKDLHDPT